MPYNAQGVQKFGWNENERADINYMYTAQIVLHVKFKKVLRKIFLSVTNVIIIIFKFDHNIFLMSCYNYLTERDS